MTTNTVYDDCVLAKADNIETYHDGSMTVTATFLSRLSFDITSVSVAFTNFRDGERRVAEPERPVRLRDNTINGVLSASNIQRRA